MRRYVAFAKEAIDQTTGMVDLDSPQVSHATLASPPPTTGQQYVAEAGGYTFNGQAVFEIVGMDGVVGTKRYRSDGTEIMSR